MKAPPKPNPMPTKAPNEGCLWKVPSKYCFVVLPYVMAWRCWPEETLVVAQVPQSRQICFLSRHLHGVEMDFKLAQTVIVP